MPDPLPQHTRPSAHRKPNILKQKNGFPPNFIHSLDSSHMMLTALHCYRWALYPHSTHSLTTWCRQAQFWAHGGDPHRVGDSL